MGSHIWAHPLRARAAAGGKDDRGRPARAPPTPPPPPPHNRAGASARSVSPARPAGAPEVLPPRSPAAPAAAAEEDGRRAESAPGTGVTPPGPEAGTGARPGPSIPSAAASVGARVPPGPRGLGRPLGREIGRAHPREASALSGDPPARAAQCPLATGPWGLGVGPGRAGPEWATAAAAVEPRYRRPCRPPPRPPLALPGPPAHSPAGSPQDSREAPPCPGPAGLHPHLPGPHPP